MIFSQLQVGKNWDIQVGTASLENNDSGPGGICSHENDWPESNNFRKWKSPNRGYER